MANVLREITSITDSDCFYIVERHKSGFTWPIHSHEEYELNFIEGGKGVRRVVGDSIEEIGDFELTLITGDGLEHVWEQGRCKGAGSDGADFLDAGDHAGLLPARYPCVQAGAYGPVPGYAPDPL